MSTELRESYAQRHPVLVKLDNVTMAHKKADMVSDASIITSQHHIRMQQAVYHRHTGHLHHLAVVANLSWYHGIMMLHVPMCKVARRDDDTHACLCSSCRSWA